MPGPPTCVVDMHHSKRRRIRLCCLPSKRRRCSCVVWGWSLYNIVEAKVTRWPVDPLIFSKKNPSRANGRSTYIHIPSLAKIRQRTSEEIGNTHTNTQTNKQTLLELYYDRHFVGIVWCTQGISHVILVYILHKISLYVYHHVNCLLTICYHIPVNFLWHFIMGMFRQLLCGTLPYLQSAFCFGYVCRHRLDRYRQGVDKSPRFSLMCLWSLSPQ